MKKFAIQSMLLLLVITGALFLFQSGGTTGRLDIPFIPQSPTFANLRINNTTLKVEVADTATKRSKGLGGRDSFAENEGMLFVFDRTDKYPFWMKGLKFPLDFVWIKDEQVVDILENIPPPSPGQPDDSLPIYSSRVEVEKVLEMNAGSVRRFNIKVGDTVSLIR